MRFKKILGAVTLAVAAAVAGAAHVTATVLLGGHVGS
jgi:hypothetical protein